MATHRDYFKMLMWNLDLAARIPALRAMAVVSIFESSMGDNHWNNPLACTLYWEGATPFNTFGDDQHVWRYRTPQDGAKAMAQMMQGDPWDEVLFKLAHARTRGPILDAFTRIYTWAHVDFAALPYNHYTAIHRRLGHTLQPYAAKDPWQK